MISTSDYLGSFQDVQKTQKYIGPYPAFLKWQKKGGEVGGGRKLMVDGCQLTENKVSIVFRSF